MTMQTYNGDLTQVIKWLQQNTPNLSALINSKNAWYSQFNDQYWQNWQANVFDLRTCNAFGIAVWCIILGVPASLFGLYGTGQEWAYGSNRQNFVDSGTNAAVTLAPGVTAPSLYYSANQVGGPYTAIPTANYTYNASTYQVSFNSTSVLPATGSYLFWGAQTVPSEVDSGGVAIVQYRPMGKVVSGQLPYAINDSTDTFNSQGGNFYGGGETTLMTIALARQVLRLRYAALVSNGSLSFINRMLAFIFNNGQPWTPAQFASGNYFYCVDSTNAPSQLLPGKPLVTKNMYLEYHVGNNMGFPAQLINLFNDSKYGVVPTCAGSSYLVIQD